MKAQNTNKLAKKTVFIYKSVKGQNNFVTETWTAEAMTTLGIFNK